jgi:uncharacterized protein YjiS (DUF1127 family)
MIKISGSTAARTTSHLRAIAHRPGLLRRWVLRWLRNHRLRRDEAFLLSQPDYMLRDIGIGRSEIEAAVRDESRWRRG